MDMTIFSPDVKLFLPIFNIFEKFIKELTKKSDIYNIKRNRFNRSSNKGKNNGNR